MKTGNPKTEVSYWDEGNKNNVKWFQKGKWKRILRKRFYKRLFKETK